MRYISLRRNYKLEIPFSEKDLLKIEHRLDKTQMGIKIESTLDGALIIFDATISDTLINEIIQLIRKNLAQTSNPSPDLPYVMMTHSFDRQTDYFNVGSTTYRQIVFQFV